VRTHGDWEGWLRFFFEGVVSTSDEAVATTRRILALFESDRRKLEKLGHAAASAFRVHEYLQRKPISGIRDIEKGLKLTYPTVASALDRMKKLHIVKELTGFKRNRVFAYEPYVALLSEGTQPLR
jgi:Fic family protein